jgi:pimeloyl-ACP methyl ester carboxylesterase
MALIVPILGAALGLAGLLGGALYLKQEKLLYLPQIPSRRYEAYPDEFDGLAYEDVTLRAVDGTRIHAWFVHPARNDEERRARVTVVYFHGNAGNLSHRLPDVRNLISFCRCNVLMVSYRGYGKSAGVPSEQGFKMDASAAIDFCLHATKEAEASENGTIATPESAVLTRRIDSDLVYVFGRSIGGAVALWLARKYGSRIRGVIVENTFTSINDMIDVVFPRGLRWLKRLNRNQWNSLALVGKIRSPVLFISGREDELVPPSQMDALYDACRVGSCMLCRMVYIRNGTHNETWYRGGEQYYRAIADFIQETRGFGSLTD